MIRRIAVGLFLLGAFTSTLAYGGKVLEDKLESKYFSVLDDWVQRGGKAQEYPSGVLDTCSKLMLVTAPLSEALSLPTFQKKEWDFRVNVCAKTTVHRVQRQSEFDDHELVQEICNDTKIPMFKRLCRHSGLG
ncbi:MAG: hypothetical protein QM706_18240 [Nitrospira sp.]